MSTIYAERRTPPSRPRGLVFLIKACLVLTAFIVPTTVGWHMITFAASEHDRRWSADWEHQRDVVRDSYAKLPLTVVSVMVNKDAILILGHTPSEPNEIHSVTPSCFNGTPQNPGPVYSSTQFSADAPVTGVLSDECEGLLDARGARTLPATALNAIPDSGYGHFAWIVFAGVVVIFAPWIVLAFYLTMGDSKKPKANPTAHPVATGA